MRTLDVRAPDGGNVPSWLMLPPTYEPGQRVPLILEIHGGPYLRLRSALLDRRSAVCGSRLCGAVHQSARLDRLRQAFADGIDKTYPGQRL